MRSSSHFKTKYITLDTRNCKACWKCIARCPQNILGKVDLFFHKHAKLKNPEKCSGCLRCIKLCEYNALVQIK